MSKQGIKFRVPRAAGLLRSIEASTVLWIPDALAEAIARHSNAYARVKKRSSRNDRSLADPDIRAGEILTFLGIYFYMGVVRLPARRDYWVVDPKWPRHPVSGKMTRGRFDYIWKNLHLVSPDDVAETTSAEKAPQAGDMESEESDVEDDNFSFSRQPVPNKIRAQGFKVVIAGSWALASHARWLPRPR